MTSGTLTYSLELRRADSAVPEIENLKATSREEAIELSRLRLLLGPDYLVVEVWRENELIARFRRDSASAYP